MLTAAQGTSLPSLGTNAVSLPVACRSKPSLAIARSPGLAAVRRPKGVGDTRDDMAGYLTSVGQDNWLEGVSVARQDLSSEYHLGRMIAAGGFGRVHLLRSHHDSRLMACKVLAKERRDRNTVSAREAYKDQVIMVRCGALPCRPSSLRYD